MIIVDFELLLVAKRWPMIYLSKKDLSERYKISLKDTVSIFSYLH